MRKITIIFILLLTVVGVTHAQDDDWQEGDDNVEYNCEAFTLILNGFEDADAEATVDALSEDFVRSDGTTYDGDSFVGIRTSNLLIKGEEVTLDAIFENAMDTCGTESGSSDDESESEEASDSETFNVIVVGNVNVRSCASTDCDVVGQATDGSVLPVIGEEDDWYEVEFEDGTVFIASWLTERGPDVYVDDLSELYVDERTGCRLVTTAQRGDMEIQILLAGDNRNDIFVDLYRPNDTNPLDVEAQLNKSFSDTGEPYIQQYYHWGLYWYTGVYELELSFDGETSRIAWNVDEQADILVYVYCD